MVDEGVQAKSPGRPLMVDHSVQGDDFVYVHQFVDVGTQSSSMVQQKSPNRKSFKDMGVQQTNRDGFQEIGIQIDSAEFRPNPTKHAQNNSD
jgi:hypothetical protein